MRRATQKWPTSAIVAFTVVLVLGIVVVQQTYLRTKAAWYAAGQSHGSVSARIELVDRLRQSGVIGKCPPAAPRNLLLNVKTDTIYVTDEGARRLCE